MRNTLRHLIFTFIIMVTDLASFQIARADGMQDALAAYQRKEYGKALKLWQPYVDQGNPGAEASVGFMFLNGLGTSKNDVEAFRLYKLAADQGFDLAQMQLGYMYIAGIGTTQNIEEGMRLYGLAAAQGNGRAKESLELIQKQIAAGTPRIYIVCDVPGGDGHDVPATFILDDISQTVNGFPAINYGPEIVRWKQGEFTYTIDRVAGSLRFLQLSGPCHRASGPKF